MSSEDFLEARNLGKCFGERWVFRDVNLALPAAQTVAIIGESGSGKTTLLQLVNGVLRPDEGSLTVMGLPVPETSLESFRRKLGYAVQGAGLFPHMTVYENVTLLARLESWTKERFEARLHELMQFMNLEPELTDRYPYQLSGGQQHRVSLCRALMLQPPALLLDEPFSAIDPITRTEIHSEFKNLQEKEQVSALLVTHDVREAVHLSHYLVVMANGAVVQHGSTDSVVASPESEYVKPLFEKHL